MVRYALPFILGLSVSVSAALADAETCENDDAPFDMRLAACEALLAEAPDDTGLLYDLADVYVDDARYADALAVFDRVIALDPEARYPRGRRSVMLVELDRFAEAEDEMRRALEQHPDWVFGQRWHANTLLRLDRAEEALGAVERSIALDPSDHWAWEELAQVQTARGDTRGAALAWHEASSRQPLWTSWHATAYSALEDEGLFDLAAYHGRIIHTLDPNNLRMRDWLVHTYLGEAPDPVLDPMPWSPPPAERQVRYFSVLAPVDNRDPTQQAIEELINFFGGRSYPMPETASVVDLSFTPLEGDRFQPSRVYAFRQSSARIINDPVPRHFALFPFDFQPLGPGEGGSQVQAVFDGAGPGTLWPLQAGNVAEGTGLYELDCSTGIGVPFVALGCLPNVEMVQPGQFSWRAEVVTDRIHVPMGIFDTYRINLEFTAEITMFTVTRSFPMTASYWIDPETGVLVAQIFTADDRYVLYQAMHVRTIEAD